MERSVPVQVYMISWLDLHKWLVFCASKNLFNFNQQFSTLCLYSHAIVDRNKMCWLVLKQHHLTLQLTVLSGNTSVIVWHMYYIHMLKQTKQTKNKTCNCYILANKSCHAYFASDAPEADQCRLKVKMFF